MSERDQQPDDATRIQPHDGLFKFAFHKPEHAAGLIRTLLPSDVCSRMDFASLELVPGTFRDVELREVETDILYRVKLDGREAMVFVLLEHQSSIDAAMPFRVLRYLVRVWERWRSEHPNENTLPVVLPIVVAHDSRPWRAPTSLAEMFDLPEPLRTALAPYLVNCRFVLDDLSRCSPEELHARQQASALARLVLLMLRLGRQGAELLEVLRGWRDVLEDVRQGPQGTDDMAAVISYTWLVAEVAPEDWRAFLHEVHIDPDEVMSAAEKLIRSVGPGIWKAEGRAEGRAEGQAEVLLRLLARRFGPLPADTEARVRAASSAEIDVMVDRVLDAKNLGDVFAA